MGGTGNDGQVGGPGHVRGGAPVEGQHLFVARAHQQQGGALHPRKITGRGEIRAPAAGDHGPYACALRGSSTQGRRSTGAGTEIPHGQQCRCGLAPGPIGHIQQALREKRDVKPRGIDTVFLWREQIDQQGRQAAFSQHPRHMVVAGAVAAAAAAVCKQHQALAVGRAIQRALDKASVHRDTNQLFRRSVHGVSPLPPLSSPATRPCPETPGSPILATREKTGQDFKARPAPRPVLPPSASRAWPCHFADA